mgnify:CR=1 FL=1
MAEDINDPNSGVRREKKHQEKMQEANLTQKEILAAIKKELNQQGEKNLGEKGNLGKDSRNIRRHLLEMKKQDAEAMAQAKELAGADAAIEEEKAKIADVKGDQEAQRATDAAEDAKETRTMFQKIGDSVKGLGTAVAGAPGAVAKSTKQGFEGLIGGLGKGGKAAGALGIGVGLAGLGVGAAAGGIGYLMDTMATLDAEKLAKNVERLARIGEENENLLADGGSLAIVLAGLGIGLMAFSVGNAATGLTQGVLDKFEMGNWAEGVRDNVNTLLSITDGKNWDAMGDAAGFAVVMAGLGAGLIAFSVGSAASGAGSAIAEGVSYFSEGDGTWADKIKYNVGVLLSINDLPHAQLGEGGIKGFIGVMSGLSLGLGMFAVAKGAAGIADFLTLTAGDNFAEDLKAEVNTLLSINDLESVQNVTVEDMKRLGGVMSALSASIGVFAIGKGAAGIADFLTMSAGTNFAIDLKDEVGTLLEIPDLPGADSTEKAKKMSAVMVELSKGIGAFGLAKGIDGIGGIIQGIGNFFSGGDSPIAQAIKIGENHEDISKGVVQLNNFTAAVENFSALGNVDTDFDAEKIAKNLLQASKSFEVALEGGEIDTWGWNNLQIKGLLNIEGIEETAEKIEELKRTLFLPPVVVGSDIAIRSSALQSGWAGKAGQEMVDASVNDNSVNTTQQAVVITGKASNATADSLRN